MKCTLCGTDNRSEAQRCKGCGASLQGAAGRPIGRPPSPTVLEQLDDGHGTAPPGSGKRQTRLASPEEQAAADREAAAALERRGFAPAVAAAASSGKRKTTYAPPDDDSTAPTSGANVARIVGCLVSYSWNSAGDMFLIREGKTTFGCEPTCDVQIAADPKLSGKHFAVMYRKGEVRVRDLDSTNATRVDGKEIWGDSTDASHGSVIEAGDSRLVLVMVPQDRNERVDA